MHTYMRILKAASCLCGDYTRTAYKSFYLYIHVNMYAYFEYNEGVLAYAAEFCCSGSERMY